MRRIFTSGLILSFSLTAWAGIPASELHDLQMVASNYEQAREVLVDRADASDEELEGFLESEDWRVRLSAAAILGWRADQALYGEAMTLHPIRTRAGFFRFPSGERFDDNTFTPVLAERLLHAEADPGVRAALAELLSRTGGDWAPAVVQALQQESDPTARVMMISVLRHGPRALAESTLQQFSADADPAMREEVALQCAWLEGSKVGATMVGTLLGDQDSSVRSVAARSAGILGLDGLVSQLATLTKDPDPAVRLHALRAIDRVGVDASKYAVSMIEDADAKVSRAAQKIVGRAR